MFQPRSVLMWHSARVLLVSTAVCGITVSALAADFLPSHFKQVAPVEYVPKPSWTGFYPGGELGSMPTDPRYTTGAVLLGTPVGVSVALEQEWSESRRAGGL